MTRDEAIEKISEATRRTGNLRSKSTIENDLIVLEVLGILKLDEPRPASEKAFDIICRDVGGIHADIILDKLRAAGLQIVEK